MKRRLLLFLAIVVSGALPLSAWADVSLVKTADGTEFKFGMSTKFVPFTLSGLDLIDDGVDRTGAATGNFRSFISPDTALGDTDWGILNYNNLLFTLERGPLRIHANIEIEVNIDANAVDQNNPNMERFAFYYKFPTVGTLAVGYDVHAFDPEGGLIYTDEHPGIWLVGGDEDLSWDVAWHYVANCTRGGSLFTNHSNLCPSTGTGAATGAQDLNTEQNNMLFLGRVNINVTDGTTVSPLIAWSRRWVPQSELFNEYSNPTGETLGDFPTANFSKSRSDQFRPGAAIKSDLGPVNLTGEIVGLLGEVRDVGAGFLGQKQPTAALDTKDDYDLRAWALFLEVALDGDTIGLPAGMTPYISFEYHSGDNDPFDDKYTGYVPISNLSQALRKDGFKGQSIASYGPGSLGANSQDGWGFDVTARGIGPTLGAIVPDETLGTIGGDTTHFNNRGGKGGNPGFTKLAAGITGKIDSNWDTHFGINALWWNSVEATKAEAAQNCTAAAALAANTGGTAPFGCAAGDPRVDQHVRQNKGIIAGALSDLDNRYMGFEINGNVGYNITGGFRIQPYFSVFIPGSSVKAIGQAFLGSSSSSGIDSETGFTGGIELSAAF